MSFYNRLNYSLGNEDWHVEEQALNVKTNDKIVCVTASGDRPMHLLLTDCEKVSAIDMNPIQNYLLELKLAAISCLDYDDYLAFIGCDKSDNRLKTFLKLKKFMSNEAFQFWKKNRGLIKKGVIFQGKVEKLTKATSKLLNLLGHKQIKKLFSFNDLGEQRNFISKEWNASLWEKVFQISLSPKLVRIFINDPGIISHIEPDINPGNYIYSRILQYLDQNVAKNSALLQLVLTGKLTKEAYFPYLTFDGYTKIRENTSKINIKTGNVIDYVTESQNGSYDCFSMSDIASYMPQDSFDKLVRGINHAAAPGARFCLRKLMSNHTMPREIEKNFVRNTELENKLEKEESNFVYKFIVGEIIK